MSSKRDNSRLPPGFSYSARTVRPKTPTQEIPEAGEPLDSVVYKAGVTAGEHLEFVGDGIVRLGQAVHRAGGKVQRKAERLALYIAAIDDCLADDEG